MKTPLYRRTWFVIGATMLAVGIFTYFLSLHTTAKYERLYPELREDTADDFLNKLENPAPETPPGKKDDAEAQKKQDAVMIHGLYGMYEYVGIVFGVLGLLFMGLSVKEPQVPTLEDLEDDDPRPEEPSKTDPKPES